MKLCIKLISVDSHFPISSDKVKVFFVPQKKKKKKKGLLGMTLFLIYISQNFVSNRYGNESNKKSTRALHSTKCFYDNVRSKTIRKKEVVCV